MVGTGAKIIGGLNESGIVTFGNGTGTLSNMTGTTAAVTQMYAAAGGTVVINQRMANNSGSGADVLGVLKIGRGEVELKNTGLASTGNSNLTLNGGTLRINRDQNTTEALGTGTLNLNGGTLHIQANTAANTTEGFANADATNILLRFQLGGSEVIAEARNGRNMTVPLGNGNANSTTSNLTRVLGASANFVEFQNGSGTAQITMNLNASSTALAKDAVIPWATYGTQPGTATDFAMVAGAASNDVRAFGTIRTLGDNNNGVSSWTAGGNISENGGAGFSGSLVGNLSISTLRFDTSADSIVNLGTHVLTIAGTGLGQGAGGILVSSNVGAGNKTITGGVGAALTTTGGLSELVVHHYGQGNLNINVPITGANALTITGPRTVTGTTIGTTGAVVLNGTNTFTGRTIINGAVLSIDSAARLGPNPGTVANSHLTLNGGSLRYTGPGLQSLGSNVGVSLEGSGGTFDIADGAGELIIANDIRSQGLYRGDLVKVGAGTLTLTGGADGNNPTFQGLIDVRQGTLRLNGDIGNAAAATSTILGTNNSFADGTILRSGANLAIQLGNGNDSGDWVIGEWFTFEGNNYVSIGTLNTQTANVSASGFVNPNNERPVNFSGVVSLNGATTFDTVPGQTFRIGWAGNGSGYLTGNGTLIKEGQGTLELRTNNPEFTGNIVINQGRLTALGQADVLGTGYEGVNKTITLGSSSRQGIAELFLHSDSAIHNWQVELNHDINVVYNPAQTKRLAFETVANGGTHLINGDIILNDNLQLYFNDGAEVGGSQNFLSINGRLRDGATTSGNILFWGDDTGGANDNVNGRPYSYFVLNNDNSLWTGDAIVSANTVYDQDQTTILRFGHNQALTAANDVIMNFNSVVQVGGMNVTIGGLTTSGGVGPFIGDAAGMSANVNGSTEIIENAAAVAGTFRITQSTPGSTEVQWDAHFRDGKLNSQFFAPGAGPINSAALNVVKAGNGWATLTVDNNYTGTTLVEAGILQVGRNGVGDTGALNAAGLTSLAGTTVAGTGQIHGASVINGQLKPGDEAGGSMGTLTFTGNVTLGATSVTTLQIQRASYTAMNAVGYDDANYASWIAGLSTDATYSHLRTDSVTLFQHDQLIINGQLTVASGALVSLLNNGYAPTHGDVFRLIDWAGLTGAFNVGGTAFNGGLLRTGGETGLDLDLPELGGNYRWDVSQFNTMGTVVVVVPEPSRALLLLFGLLGLALRRRRNR
jgi:autotransporter-associated beta strand protein